eukprot:Lankesteria_metandrocarpae@DN3841_c0_g1_i1.p1
MHVLRRAGYCISLWILGSVQFSIFGRVLLIAAQQNQPPPADRLNFNNVGARNGRPSTANTKTQSEHTFEPPFQSSPFSGNRRHDGTSSSTVPSSDEDPFTAASLSYSNNAFSVAHSKFYACRYDPRCLCRLGDYRFLGLPPQSSSRDLRSALIIWKVAADLGSGDCQFRLSSVYANMYNVPTFADASPYSAAGPGGVATGWGKSVTPIAQAVVEIDEVLIGPTTPARLPTRLRASTVSLDAFIIEATSKAHPEKLETNEPLSLLYLYSAAIAQHPGGAMALAFRHEHGIGVPKSCQVAASYYLDVASHTAHVHSRSMPQALELIRLGLPEADLAHSFKAHQTELHLHVAEQGNVKMKTFVGKRYLLGLDGFKQDFDLAFQYLSDAVGGGSAEAVSLLGYMYALGLGVEKNLDLAADCFLVGVTKFDDPRARNGLGFVNLIGTAFIKPNATRAFTFFEQAARASNADAQFNIGSMYLTGTGAPQSYHKALTWYSRALDQGHVLSAYGLALVHLNGFGTVRDCPVAVTLLKRVSERGGWSAGGLQRAYEYDSAGRHLQSAFTYWLLAETGQEVSQGNLARLLDIRSVPLFFAKSPSRMKTQAQRFYNLAALQNSIDAQLRLGDYAYYAWGVEWLTQDDTDEDSTADRDDSSISGNEQEDVSQGQRRASRGAGPGEAAFSTNRPHLVDSEGQSLDAWILSRNLLPRKLKSPRFELAYAHYSRVAEATSVPKKFAHVVAKAKYNVGHMHQWGLGVPQDFDRAKKEYEEMADTNTASFQSVAAMSVTMVEFHKLLRIFDLEFAHASVTRDKRFRAVVVNLALLLVLILLRPILKVSRRRLHSSSSEAAVAPPSSSTPPEPSIDSTDYSSFSLPETQNE